MLGTSATSSSTMGLQTGCLPDMVDMAVIGSRGKKKKKEEEVESEYREHTGGPWRGSAHSDRTLASSFSFTAAFEYNPVQGPFWG